MTRLHRWLAVLVSLASITACGGGGGGGSTATSTSNVRLVNITTNPALSLSISGTTYNTGVVSAGTGSYASITSGSYTINTTSANGALAASPSTSVSLSGSTNYSVVAYQRNGTLQNLTITDNQSTPSTGYSAISVYNAASDAGSVDVYFVAAGSSADLSTLSPQFSSVNAAASSLGQSISAGTYDIIVTAASKPDDVRLTIPAVTLTSTEIASLVLTGTSGGALVNGALIDQGGAVKVLQAADKARVRIVGSFGNDGSYVAVTLTGGKTLANLTSPSIGLYALVPASSSITSATINGATNSNISTLPSTTFSSGGDYTLLVSGTAASPQLTVLTDNNQAPSSASLAKLRLINAAVPTLSGGVSLTDNNVQLVSNLAYGTASSYAAVSTGQSALTVSSPLATFPAYTIAGSSSSLPFIASGGVYSVFVLQANPQLIVLNRDR